MEPEKTYTLDEIAKEFGVEFITCKACKRRVVKTNGRQLTCEACGKIARRQYVQAYGKWKKHPDKFKKPTSISETNGGVLAARAKSPSWRLPDGPAKAKPEEA